MDHDGKLVGNIAGELRRTQNYLVTNKLKKSKSKAKTVYAVEFNLVAQHETPFAQENTGTYVIAAANAYNPRTPLFMASSKPESFF